MPVCPRQCHFGCVLVGIEHGVHEREARVALDAGGVVALAVMVGIEHGVHEREARVALDVGGVVALAVKRVSLSSHCHSQSHGAKGPEMEPRQRLAAGSCHYVSFRCEARHICAVERALLHR